MWSFRKNKFVVKEEIKYHYYDGSKDKSTGGEDKFVSKWKMNSATDIVGKFVKRSKKAEKLSEPG